MDDEHVGFTPYKDISELKRELEGMKSGREISIKDLYDSVQKLAQTMSGMLEVFGAAAEQMKLEEREYEADAKRHEIIISKLDRMLDQNKTIAEAMVAIVDMVKSRLINTAKEKEEQPQKSGNNEDIFRTAVDRNPPQPHRQTSSQPEWQSSQNPFTPRTMNPIPQMAPPPQPAPMAFEQPQRFQPNFNSKPLDFGMSFPSMQQQPMPNMPQMQPFPPMPSMGPPPPMPGMPPMPPENAGDLDFLDEQFPTEQEESKKKGLFGMFRK